MGVRSGEVFQSCKVLFETPCIYTTTLYICGRKTKFANFIVIPRILTSS